MNEGDAEQGTVEQGTAEQGTGSSESMPSGAHPASAGPGSRVGLSLGEEEGLGEGASAAQLSTELRRTQLRLDGVRKQLDLRLADLTQLQTRSAPALEAITLERDAALAQQAAALAQRDAAHAELVALRATRTYRYSEFPRRIYGRARARLAQRHAERAG